jgi:hypothetical protein
LKPQIDIIKASIVIKAKEVRYVQGIFCIGKS